MPGLPAVKGFLPALLALLILDFMALVSWGWTVLLAPGFDWGAAGFLMGLAAYGIGSIIAFVRLQAEVKSLREDLRDHTHLDQQRETELAVEIRALREKLEQTERLLRDRIHQLANETITPLQLAQVNLATQVAELRGMLSVRGKGDV